MILDSCFRDVENAVTWALRCGLFVIINIHHFDDFINHAQENLWRYLDIVRQIGDRFRDYPQTLMFEMCNEPHNDLNNHWNEALALALPIFREHNKTRVLIIGPAGYNSRQWLSKLVVPSSERRFIITVHFYEPMNFTHNHCPYQDLSGPTGYRTHWGSTWKERAGIHTAMQDIQATVESMYGVPVNIGEFGTLPGALSYNTRRDHKISVTDSNSRDLWLKTMAEAMLGNQFSFCYFDFQSVWAGLHPHFALYDQKNQRWIGKMKDMLLIN
jgi:endoglucanase